MPRSICWRLFNFFWLYLFTAEIAETAETRQPQPSAPSAVRFVGYEEAVFATPGIRDLPRIIVTRK